MSEEIKKHIRKEAITNAVCNAVINGYIAWLIMKSKPVLPMWGLDGFWLDLLATAFLLLFIVALIIIPINRSKVSKGKLHAVSLNADVRLHRFLQRMPKSLGMRALVFGLAGLLIVAPLTLAVLTLCGISSLTPMEFAVIKGAWAGLMAGTFVIPMILLGVSETVPEVAA